ncbi:MAG: Fe(2+) transporter permease subunit FeoB [Methylococcales bacterium]
MAESYIVGVVGNPNCGKTTLFNALTGAKQHVGNWPGVTVERKTGTFKYEGDTFEVVDLPGTYSLEVSEEGVSLDEQVARDYIAAREADLIINIVDASNIERNLYLTTQLIEMKIPMLVTVNMMDVAKDRDIKIDIDGLSDQLSCPVVPVIATQKKGIKELKDNIRKYSRSHPIPTVHIRYETEIEKAIQELLPNLASHSKAHKIDDRWLSLRLLENDSLARQLTDDTIGNLADKLRTDIEKQLDEDIDILAADARYEFVGTVTRDTVKKSTEISRTISDKIDAVVLNRIMGIPIFLVVMYLMFLFTINIGSALIDFFDMSAKTIFVDGFAHVLSQADTPPWLVTLLAEGIGGGIEVVATFIPIIGCLYLFLSALEDSGYMARAAFVMDRFMRFIGLPGKAFIPLIVGFGCNVPAMMATRTMEHHRDRILTILMSPFMSCGARLPVYALFAAAFFPVGGQNLVFGLYLIGIAVAVLTGLIMKNTLLAGESSPFIMELPSYHIPTLRGILIRTWERLRSFLFRAGKVIVPMVLVLNVLGSWGTDGSFNNTDTDKSVLSSIGKTIAPAFSPMGLDENNWPAAVGIFTGILAKEAVVGTLDALYSQLASGDTDKSAENTQEFNLWTGIREALDTIPENLTDVADSMLDPIGLNIGDISTIEAAASEQEVTRSAFDAMRMRFDGQAGAFAYILFILLYFPCVAATATVLRETNMGWTLFISAWTTGIAYIAATIAYQVATFSRHPESSLFWIVGLVTGFGMVIFGLKLWGNSQKLPTDAVADYH